MPTVSVFIRKENYRKLERFSTQTSKTMGKMINELIENANVEELPERVRRGWQTA